MVKGERRIRISLFSLLCSLFLTSALQAQPLPPLGPDTTAPATPETLSAQQLDQQIQQNGVQLEQTKQRLAEVENQLADLTGKEQAGLARLASLDEQISLTRNYLARLRNQAAVRTSEMAQVARQIEQTSAEAASRKEALSRRLIAIYKYGQLNPLTALLSTRSVPEVYRKMLYLRWVVRADQRLAAELSQLNLDLAAQRARLIAARTELERLQREQLDQQAKLNMAIAAESALLKKVRNEKETGQALQQQLTESTGRLQNLLADLQRRKENTQPQSATEFETAKGSLPWPLRGKVIATFGSKVHPRYKTKTSNLGIDIKAEPSADVRAVAPGRVAYADQFMGYGNLVIVDHGGGFYTLYANLTEMTTQVGTEVTTGTKVGVVADYLHFEIRKDGKSVDPTDWLKP
ncbi:MAG: peptidoglycan DD-metalloendopeptidase family protein [candidate division WOR-3 bacterium]|nr:peptidoglycan DD-metalloendopeptidase family protein [candidate division WOR-3 bacterium]